MKIGPLETKPAPTSVAADRKAQGAAPASGSSSGPSAHVEISQAASALSGGGDGSFDTAKVERIAQAIRDGKFEVNPEAIADKLISNAQELLGKAAS